MNQDSRLKPGTREALADLKNMKASLGDHDELIKSLSALEMPGNIQRIIVESLAELATPSATIGPQSARYTAALVARTLEFALAEVCGEFSFDRPDLTSSPNLSVNELCDKLEELADHSELDYEGEMCGQPERKYSYLALQTRQLANALRPLGNERFRRW
jgi:hypothetical protein